ncbi:hypothetical protein GJAV_G00167580 [Gymnothorax javanicus]|nr:hypothetical protein GJAV_G00167580 [Gymnothorax javanicus]
MSSAERGFGGHSSGCPTYGRSYGGNFGAEIFICDLENVDETAKPRLQRGGSSASLHNSLMRNSIFQLMIHTLDPLSEGTEALRIPQLIPHPPPAPQPTENMPY